MGCADSPPKSEKCRKVSSPDLGLLVERCRSAREQAPFLSSIKIVVSLKRASLRLEKIYHEGILMLDPESLNWAELEALKNDQASEDRFLEFKSKLPGSSYHDKREFLWDVSSFANTSGGTILYGVDATDGKFSDIPGLDDFNEDHEKLRLQNLLATCVEPKIWGVDFKPISSSSSSSSKIVLAVTIPRSWQRPHMVKVKKSIRAYVRINAQRVPLDVNDLRDSFLSTASESDRIREFRLDRISAILRKDTPVHLHDQPKIILHMIPLSRRSSIDTGHRIFTSRPGHDVFLPFAELAERHRVNFDGVLAYEDSDQTPTSWSYAQLYRDGKIEAVSACLIDPKHPDDYKSWRPVSETKVFNAVTQYLALLNQIGVDLPILIMLTLTDVKGYGVMGSDRYGSPETDGHKIDRDILMLPEVLCEDFDMDSETLLRPALDALWRAGGYERHQAYDNDGKWIGYRH